MTLEPPQLWRPKVPLASTASDGCVARDDRLHLGTPAATAPLRDFPTDTRQGPDPPPANRGRHDATRSEACPVDLYVSPEGDDRADGAAADRPMRTVAAVLDRLASARPADPVTVWLRGGVYALQTPLEFTAAHSGVTFASPLGERPVLSGGRRITGWRPAEVNGHAAWAARVPEAAAGGWTFHELWVNGERRFRPRLPRGGGTYRIAGLPGVTPDTPWQQGQDRFAFAPGDIRPDFRNLGDVEAVVLHFWVDSHLPLAAVDVAGGEATFGRTSVFRMTDDFQSRGARYYLDNVFEALTEPGEWYLDRSTGTLYYLPLPGEVPETALVVAPVLSQLVRVGTGGAGDDPVSDITFDGITFSHTEWRLPPGGRGGTPQAASDVPAAIHLQNARGCVLRDCAVVHCGTYGVEVGPGCTDIMIERCRLGDLGAGGVKVCKGSAGTAITRCDIGDGGHVFHSAVGVLIFDSPGNTVADCHIHDLYYTAVSVGWVWGYGPSEARGNRVLRNHIHDIGKGMLNDMGGIYTLGVQPGTVLRGNRIHDIRSDGYGGWGIYLDEGSTDILVEDNLVYRTKTGGFHQHYGRDNVIRNNIFAFARDGHIQRTRLEEHRSFLFERNIVLLDRGPVLHGNWKAPGAAFDRNVYWHTAGGPLDFGGGRTFAQWQALGADAGSVIADPRFADPAQDDYRLRPDSPSVALGFRPFDAGPGE